MQLPVLAILLATVSPAMGQLNKLAKAVGLKYFGTAVDNPSLNNQAYMRIARDSDEFGSITPANGQKWSNTESSQGRFSYGSGDAIASVAKQSGQLLRCHTLVWHNQLPSWGQSVVEVLSSVSDIAGSKQLVQQRSDATHHHGPHPKRCRALQGPVLRLGCRERGFRGRRQVSSKSQWVTPYHLPPVPCQDSPTPVYRAMGVDFITHSFKTAAQTDPSARLYYNDFNIERCCNAKINATLAMLKTVIAAGAPVHGVGMQGHSRVGKSPSKREMKETMAKFSELVDEVAFTEVDIRHTKLPVSAEDREQQGKDYVEVVGACLETPKCVGVTVWDFTDQVRHAPRFGANLC